MSSKTTNVEQYLLGRIRSGEFPVNARVPSQHRLMAKLNCSRITVQRAMKNLIRAGFLRSEKGRGTFVLPRRAEQHLSEVVIITSDNSGIRLLIDGIEIAVAKGFDGTTLSEVLNLLKARSCSASAAR